MVIIMQINQELITYLENLSFITLSNEENQQVTKDLANILESMAKLKELDTTGVAERSHTFDDASDYREDEVKPSFERELILKNAPKRNTEAFIAPKTLD